MLNNLSQKNIFQSQDISRAKVIFLVDRDLHLDTVFLKDLWLPDIGRIVISDYDRTRHF